MDAMGQIKSYLDIAYRRRWWIVVPLVVSVATGALLLSQTDKVYQASTSILVRHQSIPEEFVRSTVTTRIEESMNSLIVTLGSRKYRERIVREFSMVPEDPTDAEVEAACRRLGSKVQYEWDRAEGSWFIVRVDDNDPVRAAGIANSLAGMFIEQHSLRRKTQASENLAQVEEWVEEKAAELDKKERVIAEYRRAHPYEMPGDQEANLQLLNSAMQQLGIVEDDIEDIERDLALLRSRKERGGAGSILDDGGGEQNPTLERYRMLLHELSDLQARYTEENPAVRSKKAQIAEFAKNNPEVLAIADPEDVSASGMSIAEQAESAEIFRLESELAQERENKRDLEEKRKLYERRLNAIPIREAEMQELERDVATLRRQYNDLLAKKETAQRSEEMESARKGEQFEIQDAASVPTLPYKPKPVQYLVMSALVGLGLGIGLVILAEFTDQTIRTEEQYRSDIPDLALLVAVPNLATGTKSSGRRRRREKKVASGGGA